MIGILGQREVPPGQKKSPLAPAGTKCLNYLTISVYQIAPRSVYLSASEDGPLHAHAGPCGQRGSVPR